MHKLACRKPHKVFLASHLFSRWLDMPERRAAHKHLFSEINNKKVLWLLLYPKVRTQEEPQLTEKRIRTMNVVKTA